MFSCHNFKESLLLSIETKVYIMYLIIHSSEEFCLQERVRYLCAVYALYICL